MADSKMQKENDFFGLLVTYPTVDQHQLSKSIYNIIEIDGHNKKYYQLTLNKKKISLLKSSVQNAAEICIKMLSLNKIKEELMTTIHQICNLEEKAKERYFIEKDETLLNKNEEEALKFYNELNESLSKKLIRPSLTRNDRWSYVVRGILHTLKYSHFPQRREQMSALVANGGLDAKFTKIRMACQQKMVESLEWEAKTLDVQQQFEENKQTLIHALDDSNSVNGFTSNVTIDFIDKIADKGVTLFESLGDLLSECISITFESDKLKKELEKKLNYQVLSTIFGNYVESYQKKKEHWEKKIEEDKDIYMQFLKKEKKKLEAFGEEISDNYNSHALALQCRKKAGEIENKIQKLLFSDYTCLEDIIIPHNDFFDVKNFKFWEIGKLIGGYDNLIQGNFKNLFSIPCAIEQLFDFCDNQLELREVEGQRTMLTVNNEKNLEKKFAYSMGMVQHYRDIIKFIYKLDVHQFEEPRENSMNGLLLKFHSQVNLQKKIVESELKQFRLVNAIEHLTNSIFPKCRMKKKSFGCCGAVYNFVSSFIENMSISYTDDHCASENQIFNLSTKTVRKRQGVSNSWFVTCNSRLSEMTLQDFIQLLKSKRMWAVLREATRVKKIEMDYGNYRKNRIIHVSIDLNKCFLYWYTHIITPAFKTFCEME